MSKVHINPANSKLTVRQALLLLMIFFCGCAHQPGPTPQDSTQLKQLEALMELERKQSFDQAYEGYKKIREINLEKNPTIATMAEWRMSYVAEALGQNTSALAHALSAEKLSEHLPQTVALAEIPARKALLYYKLVQPQEAYNSAEKAEKGLQQILNGQMIRPQDSELAEMYFNMGAATSLVKEDFDHTMNILRQRLSIQYLAKSLRYPETVHAQMAAEMLKQKFEIMWSSIFAIETRREQVPAAAATLELFETAEAYLGLPTLQTRLEKDISEKATYYQNKLRDFIYAAKEQNVLTPESRQMRWSK